MNTGKLSEVGASRRPKTGGRAKGTPNRATLLARTAIAKFVDGNAHRLQAWLDEIAEEEGAKTAFQCFMEVVEYHVPKLNRTELGVGQEGKGTQVVRIEFVSTNGS